MPLCPYVETNQGILTMTETAKEKLARHRAMFAESANAMLDSLADLADQWAGDIKLNPNGQKFNNLLHRIADTRHAIHMTAVDAQDNRTK